MDDLAVGGKQGRVAETGDQGGGGGHIG
jgi:hypothetical protein